MSRPPSRWVRVDRRYRNPYRWTPYAYRVFGKWAALLAAWFVVVIALGNGILDLAVTIGLGWYALRRVRRYRRELAPPPPPVYLPPDAPVGERRTRQAIPQAVKVAVAARDHGQCQCRAGTTCHGYPEVCGSTLEPHFDHVIAWSRGGADTVANLQILCGPCNRRKGADDIT